MTARRGPGWYRRWSPALVGGAILAAVVVGCAPGAGPRRGAAPAPVDTTVAGSHGVVEHVALPGSSFGVHGGYSIYLPAGYGQDARRRYPVVYLLHAGSSSDSFFLDLGVRPTMDAAVGSGAVGPMILVLVDGGPKFAGDGRAGTRFGDYVAAELLPDVDARWRTVAERTSRAVGGISLGGRYALEFAAEHPSLVAAVGGHSTSIPHSPDLLAAAGIPIYLDVGQSDGLFARDQTLATSLRGLGADVRWHPAEGGHAGTYWSAHLVDYLRFYSDALGAGSR